MKKIILGFSLVSILFLVTNHAKADEYVHGYFKSNGTYVNGYYRSSPDGNPFNNYSFPGNYNPYTGEIAPGNPDTYLDNYYSESSGNTYSPIYYPSIPTCPINSYYDGTSSCKCNYGYVNSGGACVSTASYCGQQIGYMSSYDSLTGNCKCDSGYVLGSDGTCQTGNYVCSEKFGSMSEYDSLTNTCGCMSGYSFNGTSCVYNPTPTDPYSSFTSMCPANSHVSSSDSSKCVCDDGYQVNSAGDTCIPSQNVNSTNFVSSATNTNNASCSAYGSGAELIGSICYCSSGYVWNKALNYCVEGNPQFEEYLLLGSAGTDVVNLKNFLALQHVFTGYVTGKYDNNTEKAVQAFQLANSINPTGTVGPKTRAKINSIILGF